jgi:hypothetical protein
MRSLFMAIAVLVSGALMIVDAAADAAPRHAVPASTAGPSSTPTTAVPPETRDR